MLRAGVSMKNNHVGVRGSFFLHSRIMTIAINIINTWWYPRNGMKSTKRMDMSV